MDFPISSKEELEEIFSLVGDVWKNPGLNTWISLADLLYEETFGDSTVEEEEKEAEMRAEGEVIMYDDLLHALVEVTWEAWVSNPERCRSWVQVGIEGDTKTGLPPFLNMRAGSAHLDLALFMERAGEITLTENSQALGRALLLLHMSEAYIRPGMATAAFLLRVWMKKEGSFEDDLLYKHNRRGFEMASYGATRAGFKDRITAAKKMYKERSCLEVLDNLISNDDAELTLSELRNAIGHHNLDILDGAIRIGWVKGYPEWDPENLKTISSERLKDILWGMRGLVMTLLTWERMMLMVFNPPKDPEKFDAAAYAEDLHNGLTFFKSIFQAFF